MTNQQFDPEKLRPLNYICEPDPRNTMLVKVDLIKGTSRPIEAADHYDIISKYVLHAGVPQGVALQFETARNLYLYSWFIYRFYPVAEHHGLSCLELALRERLKEEIRAGKLKEKRPGLSSLLKYAADLGLIRNEGFATWRNRGEINSRHRVEMEKIREATERNLDSITWRESDIQVTAEDLNWDYVAMLVSTLPKSRNEYAHGSTILHNSVSGMIQIVCEIVNQLFEPPHEGHVTP